jgi:hypothetical protein
VLEGKVCAGKELPDLLAIFLLKEMQVGFVSLIVGLYTFRRRGYHKIIDDRLNDRTHSPSRYVPRSNPPSSSNLLADKSGRDSMCSLRVLPSRFLGTFTFRVSLMPGANDGSRTVARSGGFCYGLSSSR